MATLAAYPEWYERSGNVVLLQDITEVAVVRIYDPIGNEAVSWDASAGLDSSIMAHIVGTRLFLVCDSLTEIPEKAFNSFLSVEKFSGFHSVKSIGARAFFRCLSVKYIDIDPAKLTNIGDDAFRMSCVEDVLDISKLPADAVVGARATRTKRWGNGLANVQAVAFPIKRIYFNVPHADSQLREKYADIPFVRPDSIDGDPTLYNGCSVFTMYHTWNLLYAGTDKEYGDMEAWWNATLNKDGDYAEKTSLDTPAFWHDTTAALGWDYNINTDQVRIVGASQLETILNALSDGFPVNTTIKTGAAFHNVLIIGCDPKTRKLAFVDSGVRPDRGAIYWCAYEDLYIEGYGTQDASECIRLIDYKPPVLAQNCSWFTQGGTTVKRASITEIEIVREYTPTGSETTSWDASAEKNGSVMAYVNGTKLTIAGNGYYSIWANEDSSWAFSDSSKTDYFRYATSFNGLQLLNTSNAVNMERMFRQLGEYAPISDLYLDVSNWNVSKVQNMMSTFDRTPIEILPVDDWDVSSVDTFASFVYSCYYLKELNLSKWEMKKEADTSSMLLTTWRLEKITLGGGFNVNNDTTTATFTATDAEHIPYADGNWYDHNYNAYTPTDIPSGVARTYYASKLIAADDDDTMVFVRNGTLRKLAVAIRHKNGKTDTMLPSAFADEVLALEIQQN